MISRLIYLAYYFRQTDKKKLGVFLDHASASAKRSRTSLFISAIVNSLIYNISILEYFQFRFFEKKRKEKLKWAGTGFMYEYQLKMNPKAKRDILDDKRKFYKKYQRFFIHKVYELSELKNNSIAVQSLLSNKTGKIVLKLSDGKCGAQVVIKDALAFNGEELISYMVSNGFDLAEEFIEQHPEMNRLSPSGVNTVRIITQLNSTDEVDILGCRLRITVNSAVDNMAAGNLAAPVNPETGVVTGDAVYSDISRVDESLHPVTKTEIKGFQIPFWKETLELAVNAQLLHKQNRSIGWDIAVTPEGPDLIEGNHDWCKLLWQLPVNQGMKFVLEKYIN